MKKIFFILIILFFYTPTTSAQDNLDSAELRRVCEQLDIKPRLVFYTSYGKLEYNKQYSKKSLTKLGKKMKIFEEGDLASGLALVDVASEYELNTSIRKMINNASCVIPQELSVYIGFQNPIIYLANDLKVDTCLYNLVLRHEQIHQQINVNALEYFIPIIYDRIKMIMKGMTPLYIPAEQNVESATNDLTVHYAKQINTLVDEFKQEILIEQQKLDNRQNYQLESNICQQFNKKNAKRK